MVAEIIACSHFWGSLVVLERIWFHQDSTVVVGKPSNEVVKEVFLHLNVIKW